MKKYLVLLLTLFSLTAIGYQIIPEQVTIGEQKKPDASASLELRGTGRGLLINRLTSTERDGIASPATGLVIFNSTSNIIEYYNGSSWVPATGGSITEWMPMADYVTNDIVVDNSKIYRSTDNHTATGSFEDDFLAGHWELLSGGIKPPVGATDNALIRFDGATGDSGQNSLAILDDTGNLTGLQSIAIGGAINTSSLFDVISTGKGARPCPAMTQTQRDAIATPANSLCIYNTTQGKLNIYNGTIWKAAGGGVDPWLTLTVYAVNDVVIQSSKLYQCLIAHTSGTFATDLVNGNWVEISAQENLTGAVTSVGPVTSLGSFTSANLAGALTNETGSGAAVFATSPTLITPALGTPSALVGTNITGTAAGLTAGTVTTNANLTGEVTSVGNAATVPNATVIGKVLTGFTPAAGTIAATDTILQAFNKADGNTALKLGLTKSEVDSSAVVTTEIDVPLDQLTTTGTNKRLLETGNTNLLKNAGIESATLTGWSCPTGTASITTEALVAGSRYKGLQALKAVSTGAGIRCIQSVTTNAAALANQQMNLKLMVNSTDPLLQVCSLEGGTSSSFDFNCKTVPVTTTAKPWQPVIISFIGNGTSNGIVFKSATTTTQNIYVDDGSVGDGLPGLISILGDTVYSARVVTTSGVFANGETRGLIASCTAANPTECTFVSGRFTSAPQCTIGASAGNVIQHYFDGAPTANSFFLRSYNTTTGAAAATAQAHVICKKTGADYENAAGSAYSVGGNVLTNTTDSSAVVTTTSGSVANESVDFIASCTAVNPTVCTFTANYFTVTPNCTVSQTAFVSSLPIISSVSSTSVAIRTLNSTTGSDVASQPVTLHCQKAGADYMNAFKPLIVGSFTGIPVVPGYEGRVDTFSVTYGTTAATTNCTATPCSYLDQIGNVVSSMARTTTGAYMMNLSKTYSKLKCTSSVNIFGVSNGVTGSLQCTACSSLSFATQAITTGTQSDSAGTLTCQGTY